MGIRDNMFVYDGISSRDFGLLISGFGTNSVASRDIDTVVVPGRNGEIIVDTGGFKNVDVTYKCLLLRHFKTDYPSFVAYLYSDMTYKRLEDSFHPDEFRLAVIKKPVDPKLYDYDNANFTITFNCKPQRWLKSGEEVTTMNGGGTIYNETLFEAKPLLRIYNTGTLTINDKSLVISEVDEYVDVDCETLSVTKGSINKSHTVNGTFPTLEHGDNVVTFSGKVDITPRWWRL